MEKYEDGKEPKEGEQKVEVDDKQLQIWNLKHNLDMLGKALDSKDKMLWSLCARCAYITNKSVCSRCDFQDSCSILLRRFSEEFWYDKVIEAWKHPKWNK